MKKRPIRVNGLIVGHIVEKDYVTTRRPEHFFIKYHGFGISTSILRVLIKNKVKNIIINYKGSKHIVYKSQIEDWLYSGVKVKEKGYDSQYILDRDKMEELCLE